MHARTQRGASALACLLLVLGMLGGTLADPASATSDTTPPVLHSIALGAPGPYTMGDTLTVLWDATDDVGVQQVQVRFLDAAGKDHTVYANGGAASGTAPIDARWASGDVVVQFAQVLDVNGNYAWYFPGGRLTLQPGGESTHTVDLGAGSFSTFGVGDVIAPLLQSVALTSPGPFTAGDTVTVAWTATDTSGIWFFSAVFLDAAGKQHAFQTNGDNSTVSKVIDASWANGPVTLAEVDLDDEAGNSSYYLPDGTAVHKPQGSGPGTHSQDFGALAFTTDDTGADTSPPVLSQVALQSSGPFVEGDPATYEWQISDNSGVAHVAIDVADSANKGHFLYAATGTRVSTVIDASWAIGTARVSTIRVSDDNGNSATYYANGNVSTIPEGSGTHTLDFSALSFEVQGQPTVAMTEKPAARSASRSASFAFLSADRDDEPSALTLTCALDSADLACSDGGVEVSDLSTGTHELAVTVTDPQGHHSATSYVWQVDPEAPTAGITPFGSAFVLAPTAVVRWSGTDTGTGVASYDVRHQVTSAQGAVGPWVLPSAWQRTTRTGVTSPTLTPGGTTCFQTRARDLVGNTSAWSTSRCLARAVDDAALAAVGSWRVATGSGYYNGSAWRTSTLGAGLSSEPVQLRRVGIVATTCPTCGTVGVYVGGRLMGRLNLTSATTRHRQLLALPAFARRSGAVTLKVLSTGRLVTVDGLLLSAV